MSTLTSLKPVRRPSKTAVLCDKLRDLALQLGPEARLPSVVKLCSGLDVAKVTLDGALRRLEDERVLVRQPGRGIFVSRSIAQKTIAVVFGGDIFSTRYSPVWTLLLQAAGKQSAERNCRPMAYLDIAGPAGGLAAQEQLVDDLEHRRVHGILLLSPSYQFNEVKQLSSYGVPLVVFGGVTEGWVVTHASLPVFSFAAKELTDRGCRRIALMGLVGVGQQQKLADALQQHHFAGEPILDWSYDTWARQIPGDYTHESFGRQVAQRMIAARQQSPLPEALVSLDDTMTRGVISAMHEAGLRPGRDIHIVTIANNGSPVLEPYASNLIQIVYDPADSVRASLDMLEVLMAGQTPQQNPVLIAPTLRRQPPE